jgi:hypothetical protein
LRTFSGQFFAERAIDFLPALRVLGIPDEKIRNHVADFGRNGDGHSGVINYPLGVSFIVQRNRHTMIENR